MIKIAVLIVTFNRLEKLKKCLKSYTNQSMHPNVMMVIDNFSTDGTKEFLDRWRLEGEQFEKHVVHLNKNVGGSGGFYEGIRRILEYEFDWLWISDDDAYPDEDALLWTYKAINHYDCDVVCSTVNTNEGIDVGHRKRITKENYNRFGDPIPFEFYRKNYFKISVFSFVGTCIKRRVLNQCGLPERNYFIWFDDTEYSLRLYKKYKIICVPRINVFHDTIIEKDWKYSWKTYYGERNKLYTMQKHMRKWQFRIYRLRFVLGMIKHFFSDYDYYISQKDGYKDFKKGIVGLSQQHMPGSRPQFRHR